MKIRSLYCNLQEVRILLLLLAQFLMQFVLNQLLLTSSNSIRSGINAWSISLPPKFQGDIDPFFIFFSSVLLYHNLYLDTSYLNFVDNILLGNEK